MSVSSKVSQDGQSLTITIDGRFDFSTHSNFRQCYKDIEPQPKECVVDLSTTTYLDSSALGMLLLLRDYAGDKAELQISNPNPEVQKILEIANFGRLFKIINDGPSC